MGRILAVSSEDLRWRIHDGRYFVRVLILGGRKDIHNYFLYAPIRQRQTVGDEVWWLREVFHAVASLVRVPGRVRGNGNGPHEISNELRSRVGDRTRRFSLKSASRE